MSKLPDPVLLDISPEGVAVLTLNRPSHSNAIDELLVDGLAEALETLRGADHVRIVFVRGAGADFCTGVDSGWLGRWVEQPHAENEKAMLAYGRVLKALHDLPEFTVALVHGEARGGGVGIVAACDWAVALSSASFRLPEVRVGLIPALAGAYVIEAIGARHTRAYVASAQPFSGQRAYEMGLVHEVVENEAALEGALKRLAGLALENAPGAVEASKLIVREFAGRPIDERIVKEGAKRLADRAEDEEAREGVAAHLAKRPPAWDKGVR